jgi:hypothetical protein
MHWTVTGNPDQIVQHAKEAIMQTSSYATATAPNAANATRPAGTPSSAGPYLYNIHIIFFSLFLSCQ